MAVTYGFFNSVEGDRKYNAEDMSHYFEGLVSNGVYENVGNKLAVTADNNDMSVNVGTGRALIDCHWIKNDESLRLEIDSQDEETRSDYIVIKLDLNESARKMTIEVSKNIMPSDSAYIKYLILAKVNIEPGATKINQVNIEDLRGTSRCLYVTGLIKQLDTSDLFLQWQAFMEQKAEAFNDWYNSLTETLIVDTYIQKYQNSYIITSTQESDRRYPIGIPEYAPNKDVLFVYVDGVTLVEGVDFILPDVTEHYPDVNGDGTVNSRDTALISEAAANIGAGMPSGLTPEQEILADADMNGKINTKDTSLVNEFVAGAGIGTYENSLEGWIEFITDKLDTLSFISPLKNAYRAGSQITFVVLKSRIGSSTDDGILTRLAQIVDIE